MSTTLIDQIIEPFAEFLTIEAARKIVNAQPKPEVQKRVDELAEMSRVGMLNEADSAEYCAYLAELHVVKAIKACAQRVIDS